MERDSEGLSKRAGLIIKRISEKNKKFKLSVGKYLEKLTPVLDKIVKE